MALHETACFYSFPTVVQQQQQEEEEQRQKLNIIMFFATLCVILFFPIMQLPKCYHHFNCYINCSSCRLDEEMADHALIHVKHLHLCQFVFQRSLRGV